MADVGNGEVGEEDGLVVGGEEEGGEGSFGVVGGCILEESEGVREGLGDEGCGYGVLVSFFSSYGQHWGSWCS